MPYQHNVLIPHWLRPWRQFCSKQMKILCATETNTFRLSVAGSPYIGLYGGSSLRGLEGSGWHQERKMDENEITIHLCSTVHFQECTFLDKENNKKQYDTVIAHRPSLKHERSRTLELLFSVGNGLPHYPGQALTHTNITVSASHHKDSSVGAICEGQILPHSYQKRRRKLTSKPTGERS